MLVIITPIEVEWDERAWLQQLLKLEGERRYLEMKSKEIPAIVIIVVLLSFFGVMAFAA